MLGCFWNECLVFGGGKWWFAIPTSTVHNGKAGAEEENVEGRFLCFDLVAYLVYGTYQAHVGRDEYILAGGVERFALGGDAVAGGLGAADEVGAWAGGVVGEVLEGCEADAAGGADEEGDEGGWEGG